MTHSFVFRKRRRTECFSCNCETERAFNDRPVTLMQKRNSKRAVVGVALAFAFEPPLVALIVHEIVRGTVRETPHDPAPTHPVRAVRAPPQRSATFGDVRASSTSPPAAAEDLPI